MLQTFLPLFVMTFGICLFIVLMQFLWRYIDDMVGKGLEIAVLGEMFLYAALFLVPMALPLAILLASLMTFGNLGERLELLAMKSAGVSLINIMKPLIILIASVSIGAFFFQNDAMPVINVKLYSLLHSIKQKSPELQVPEGVFFGDIADYSMYVKKKDPKTGQLQDMIIYDYTAGFNNARVILADSGRLKTSADKLFLVITMYDGESFENMSNDASTPRSSNAEQKAVPYRRESFASKEILIRYDGNFTRMDDSFLQNQYMGKDLKDLQSSIDSMSVRLDSIKDMNANSIFESSYKRNFIVRDTDNQYRDSLNEQKEHGKIIKRIDASAVKLNFDSLYQAQAPSGKAAVLARVKTSIEHVKGDYQFRALTLGSDAQIMRRHITEWHKKFTLSCACLVFFFIGAPLGAIIRKGGLGVPVIISVLLFIFYYIVDNIGFKMARDGVWPAWQGMWLSSAVLAPMGVFLTYKAVNDSVIMNADTYLNAFKKLLGRRSGRKVDMKEVIIFTPDYPTVSARLGKLIIASEEYLRSHKRWTNYFTFWKEGGRDIEAKKIAKETEEIVEELSNSDQILILNKLMDYPVIAGYNLLPGNMSKQMGMAIGIFFPLGIILYLFAIYKRRLLRQDIKAVNRTSSELLDIIAEL